MWVLKIGGSWITNPNLKTLLKRLEKKKRGKIIIVAGGGCFADSVRFAFKKTRMSEKIANTLALKSTEIFSSYMKDINKNLHLTSKKRFKKNSINVWLPSMTLSEERSFKKNWNSTSDSIAAWLSSNLNNQRWAWVLTGSGHFFNESIDLINSLDNLDLFVSKAADEVLSMYKKKGKLSKKIKIYKDSSSSSVTVGRFYKSYYHTLVMAPTSSNTVAKCVYGISDTLATNIFAQSGKCRVECIYFPCDTAPELETLSPKGYVKVFPRRIDLENVRNLKKFERTNVVMSFKELKKEVKKREKCLKKFSS